MNAVEPAFELLLSDEVFTEGILASDIRSLWRRLARTRAVRRVGSALSGDPDRIRALCAFVEALLAEPHDAGYRHPQDIAICAGLVLLESSPLSSVRGLVARLQGLQAQSLVWVGRMAQYAQERFVESQRTEVALASGPSLVHLAAPDRNSVQMEWADPDLETRRYGFPVSA